METIINAYHIIITPDNMIGMIFTLMFMVLGLLIFIIYVLLDIVANPATTNRNSTVDHFEDPYLDAFEGDPIDPDKRTNTIRGQ